MALGIACLVVQVFAYRFDRWTGNPNLRVVYAVACAVLPCELPVLRSVGDISVLEVAVRPHSGTAAMEAFTIAAVLRNEASFAQPFPELELRLSNMAGELVAARRFRPEEYLGERHRPGASMPSGTPIPVAVDVHGIPVEAVNVKFVPR